MKFRLFLVFFLYFFISSPLLAEELNYNLVNFGVGVEDDVRNDRMNVTLLASSQALRPQDANKKVNEDMVWALAIVKKESSVEAKTLGYHTTPQYKNRVVVGWNVSQKILLESNEVLGLTELAGELQARLKIDGMQFYPSAAARKKVVDVLLEKAIKEFRQKALLIVNSVGGNDYKVVNVNISDGGSRPVIQRNYRMETMAMDSMSNSPATMAGQSNVTVRVDGTIQILY